MGLVAWRQTP